MRKASPSQLLEVAITLHRYITGGYPPDLFLKRYKAVRLDPDYRPATRPPLIGLLGRSDMFDVWHSMTDTSKRIVKAPGRYSQKEYIAAIEEAWCLLQRLNKI